MSCHADHTRYHVTVAHCGMDSEGWQVGMLLDGLRKREPVLEQEKRACIAAGNPPAFKESEVIQFNKVSIYKVTQAPTHPLYCRQEVQSNDRLTIQSVALMYTT